MVWLSNNMLKSNNMLNGSTYELSREIIRDGVRATCGQDLANNEDFLDHTIIQALSSDGFGPLDIEVAATVVLAQIREYIDKTGPEAAITNCSYAIHAINAPDEKLWALHIFHHKVSA